MESYLANSTPSQSRPVSAVEACHGSVASSLTSSQNESRPKSEFASWIEANQANYETLDEALAAMLEFKGISSPTALMHRDDQIIMNEGTVVTNDTTMEEASKMQDAIVRFGCGFY
jgi:hypothetical protein